MGFIIFKHITVIIVTYFELHKEMNLDSDTNENAWRFYLNSAFSSYRKETEKSDYALFICTFICIRCFICLMTHT